MSDPYPSLKSLRDSAAMLNKITDEANIAVARVEGVLNEFGVGLGDYFLVKGPEAEPRKGHSQFLECKRVNEKHRICVVWNEGNTFKEESCKPWSDCTRTEKLQTVKKLGDFLAKIIEVVDAQLAMATAALPAIERVKNVLDGYAEGE